MIIPMTKTSNDRTIKIQCPTCKTTKDVSIPESIVNGTGQMTTFSVPKGAVCEHHFQLFLDKNFKIRGYQKVDFEFTNALNLIKDKDPEKIEKKNEIDKNNKDLFDNLALEGNSIEYLPPIKKNMLKKQEEKDSSHQISYPNKANLSKTSKTSLKSKEMILKEIYDEFWDLIDDDHPEFQEFIIKDPRRSQLKSVISY